MARILLSAYACDPKRGSEHAVGWNWAVELGRLGHEVCVVTRARNRAAIAADQESKLPNLRFAYYELPPWMQVCKSFPGGNGLYYLAWQCFAARYIRHNVAIKSFDCAHHITFASVRYPSFFAFLGIPFYFGPVSGGESVPKRLRSDFSMPQRWRELGRDLSNAFVRFDPIMHMVFRRSSRIVVTPETKRLVPVKFQAKCTTSLAIGISSFPEASHPMSERTAPEFAARASLLFVGRLLEWKRLDIALRCVSRLKQCFPELRLTIAGDGPAKARLLRLARTLGVENHLRWTGWLSRAQLQVEYRRAQLLLFPSLRDSGGLVVLEAMANGLPVLCADRGGPGLLVTSQCGCVIPTENKTSNQLVSEIVSAAATLLSNPELRERKSLAARERARQFQFRNVVTSLYPVPAGETQPRFALG